MGETVSKLSPEGQEALTKLAGSLDTDSLNFITRIGSKIDAGDLENLVKAVDKLPDQVTEAIKFFDNALDKLGIEITGDIATRLAKGFAKIIPGIGAIPALIDAEQALRIAGDDNYPPDIRQLALLNAKINGADVATSVVEVFTSQFVVPIGVDLAVGAAALLTDLVLTDQISKFEAAQAEGLAILGTEGVSAGIEAAKEAATELLSEGVESVVNVVKSLGTNVGAGHNVITSTIPFLKIEGGLKHPLQ